VNHRYFLHGGQDGNHYLEEFYDAVLNGKPANLDPNEIKEVKQGKGNKIFVFKAE
jgi:hypothetical protein